MGQGVYIHIPFCIRKCRYCDFHSGPYDIESSERYISALTKEIQARLASIKIDTLYIGGGTPSILGASGIGRIMEAVVRAASVSPEAELTIEANPGALDHKTALEFRAMGINRISIGVQSFDNRLLALLGRAHSAEDARALLHLQGRPFDNVSVDLMYAIPGQDMSTWQATLEDALALEPSHISAYELTPEPGTPIHAELESGALRLPEEGEALAMQELAIDMLSARGLSRYEVSNYAMPGRHCRHNLNYWMRGPYIGIGSGAHGFDPATKPHGARTQNIDHTLKYCMALESGCSPVAETTLLTSQDACREVLFLGLRTIGGIALSSLPLSGIEDAAGPFIRDRLMEISDGKLRFTREGMSISNTLLVMLFEGLGL